MNSCKVKRIQNGWTAVLVGIGSGVILRILMMVCFFDYETGFYTDKGIAAWLSLLLPLAAAVLGGVLFARAKADFGSYVRRKNYPAGIMAVISGLVLLYTGAVMVMDYVSYRESGFSQFESARQG